MTVIAVPKALISVLHVWGAALASLSCASKVQPRARIGTDAQLPPAPLRSHTVSQLSQGLAAFSTGWSCFGTHSGLGRGWAGNRTASVIWYVEHSPATSPAQTSSPDFPPSSDPIFPTRQLRAYLCPTVPLALLPSLSC